ncbi:aminoglycoside phosphotransferase [Lentzea sp. NBRC 105346]|uniref:phosphotransferase enzyme family protein n=1 Tax=Lentzea sp. NBRC 105346 TaxID=3032205 RepID=UPI0024A537AA|nr:phosphotransferase [Lentzea sp. NBRC 105346]GLZ29655.1 aminoglycoside phosphotransferase [Lentzea sp. NBRC 105346]
MFSELTQAGQTRRMRRLVLGALVQYDLPVTRLTPMGGGWNTTFRVDAGERYVMRVQREDGATPEQLRSEMTWLRRLRHDTDLGVPDPVPTRDGDLVAVAGDPLVPGERGCVLYRWVEGRFLDRSLTPAHLYEVGVLMARLQEHGATMAPLARPAPDFLTERAAELVRAAHSAEGAKLVATAMARIARTKEALGTGPDAYGLIHADLHYENFLFHGAEARAIDFDDCGYAHFAYDLAVTIFELRSGSGLRDREKLQDAVRAGYRSVRPLPPDEAIEDLIMLRRLQLALYMVEHRDEPMFRSKWSDELEWCLKKLATA